MSKRKKFFLKLKEFFKLYWLKLLSAFITGLLITIIFLAINTNYDAWILPRYYSDGFFIAGVIVFCLGMFSLVNLFGGFDVFSYLFTREKTNYGARVSLYEYSEIKKEKRKLKKLNFLSYFLNALFFIILGLICFALI